MKRPIWYFSGEINSHLREGISAFGNPLIWWMGIPAFLFILYLIYKKRDRNAIYLTFGYLSQYLPWIFIGRVVFIYHYFPSVPFVTLMIGYSMKKIGGSVIYHVLSGYFRKSGRSVICSEIPEMV